MNLEFSVQIYGKYSYINFMKLRPVGAELHADGQTDMMKLIVAFRNFANAPEKYRVIHKSLRDFRIRLRNNQDRHGRKEHINK